MNDNFCTIKTLPQSELVAAAARAIVINPANAPATEVLRAAMPVAVPPPEHGVRSGYV